jgi:hypothetical protein
MLCIPDSTLNTWIANQISQHGYSKSWIGYSDLPNNDGYFEWISGCSSSYTNGDFVYSRWYYYAYIQANTGAWDTADGQTYSYLIACSCEYIASTSLPTISPSTHSGDDDDTSATIGIIVGCVVFTIIVVLILMYFFCNSTNPVCTSLLKFPSNNDDISSSHKAYTDIPPTYLYPPSDDDDGGLVISSSTEVLQIVVTNIDHCAYDEVRSK